MPLIDLSDDNIKMLAEVLNQAKEKGIEVRELTAPKLSKTELSRLKYKRYIKTGII